MKSLVIVPVVKAVTELIHVLLHMLDRHVVEYPVHVSFQNRPKNSLSRWCVCRLRVNMLPYGQFFRRTKLYSFPWSRFTAITQVKMCVPENRPFQRRKLGLAVVAIQLAPVIVLVIYPFVNTSAFRTQITALYLVATTIAPFSSGNLLVNSK